MVEFYRETEFKEETEIGRIPKDWKIVELKEIAKELYYGLTAKAVERDTRLRMLRTTDIKDYSVNWNALPFCEITDKRRYNISRYLPQKGDIIVARAGTVGVSVLVEEDFDDVIFGSYLIKIKLKAEVEPKFIHYFFQSRLYWQHIQRAQGSTLKNINLPLLKSLKIPLPPPEEQELIAEVLYSMDEAIRAVDASIAKYERLKRGLVQELLTKGVGHKEFKEEAEIGRIPASWEATNLGSVCSPVKDTVMPNEVDNMPYVGLEHIVPGDIFLTHIGRATDVKSAKYRFRKGDVLYGKLRPYLDKAVLSHLDGICSTDILVLRPKKDVILPEFIVYLLHTKEFVRYATSTMRGTNHPRTSWKAISRYKLPLPPINEQKSIVRILSTVDEVLINKKMKKSRLERMKKALMGTLLTGKVRVRA